MPKSQGIKDRSIRVPSKCASMVSI